MTPRALTATLVVFTTVLLVAPVWAQQSVPLEIPYFGSLENVGGGGVTGTFDLTIRLYDHSSGGDPIWEEEHTDVPVVGGAFSVVLGSVEVLDSQWFAVDDDLYWAVQVDDNEEMTPRLRVLSVPYAIVASYAYGCDESDPEVGALAEGKWCKSDGGTVSCESDLWAAPGNLNEDGSLEVGHSIDIHYPGNSADFDSRITMQDDQHLGLIANYVQFADPSEINSPFITFSEGLIEVGVTEINVNATRLEMTADEVQINNASSITAFAANPILTLQDSSTGHADAVSVLRLAESGLAGVLDSYWDMRLDTVSAFSLSFFNHTDSDPVLSLRPDASVVINGRASNGYALFVNGDAAKTSGNDAWTIYSDGRLKDVHGVFDRGLSTILAITPVSYTYRHGNTLRLPTENEYVGVVAQELREVIPEAVSESANGFLTMNSSPIFWASINAIKELNGTIVVLERELTQLQRENAELRATLKRLQRELDGLEESQDSLQRELESIRTRLPAEPGLD